MALSTFVPDTHFSCSCGKCTGGWLSARRAQQLRQAAESAGDNGRALVAYDDDLPNMAKWEKEKVEGVHLASMPLAEHIPKAVKKKGLTRKFLLGFYGMERLIGHILHRGLVPTREVIEDTVRILKGQDPEDPSVAESMPATSIPLVCNAAQIECFMETVRGWLRKTYGSYAARMAGGTDDGVALALYAAITYAEEEEREAAFGSDGNEGEERLPRCTNDSVNWMMVILRHLTDAS